MNPNVRNDSAVLGDVHRTDLVTILFTDIVGSTSLKHQLGDRAGASLIQRHHALVRQTLTGFATGKEVNTAGDSFLIIFVTPSAAVEFALLLQAQLRGFSEANSVELQDRIGIHLGEVVIQEHAQGLKPMDLSGIQVDVCARVMSLAKGGQVLMTRAVFDNARQVLKVSDLPGVGQLSWLNHGSYEIKGLQEPIEICEVGEVGQGPLTTPVTSEKAHPHRAEGVESVLGWRPAVGQLVPNTQWLLERKLGEGGFGEVWLGRHETMKERRVFKFCFRADRVRYLKREMTLLRLLKERVGHHPNIVALRDVYFEAPPFYVEMDYVEGNDLRRSCEDEGGVTSLPLETRLEIIAQVADALQAAHDAGVIHRDVKPSNILIENPKPKTRDSKDENEPSATVAGEKAQSESDPPQIGSIIHAKLTDFGIGQVVSEECLSEITRAGFTQTILSDASSSHVGTQMFMAPELLAGKSASTRSDIYSLGIVLYQIVAGDFSRSLSSDWDEDIQDPLLREDLRRCLARNPQDRFSGAAQLATRLRNLPQRHRALVEEQAAQAALERAAYRRGVLRTAVVALLVLAIVVGLAITAGMQARRANQIAKEQRLQLYVTDMKLAHMASEENNLGLAMDLVRKYQSSDPELANLRGFEWRYLWNLCQGDEMFSLPHDDFVCAVAFSVDMRHLATATCSHGIQIWDLQSRKPVAHFAAQQNSTGQVPIAFSEDGRWFASVQSDRVLLRETAKWEVSRELAGPKGGLGSIAFNADSTALVAVGGNQAFLWDLTRDEEARSLPLLPNVAQPRRHAGFSADGRLVVAGTDDGVYLWDRKVNLSPSHLPFESGRLSAMAISKQGQIAMAGNEGDLFLWDLPTRRQIGHVRHAHSATIYSIAFSPNGRTLASGGGDQWICLWDTTNLEKRSKLRGHLNELWSVIFSRDGRFIASGSKDQTAKIWSTEDRPTADILPGSFMPITFLPDGKTLLALTPKRDIQFWDIAKAELRRSFTVPTNSVSWVNASSLGHVGASIDRKILQIWDSAGTNVLHTLPVGDRTLREIGLFQFSPDGVLLGVACQVTSGGRETQAVEVFRVREGDLVAHLNGVTRPIAISHNGKLIAVSRPGFRIGVYDVESQKQISEMPGHLWDITWLEFSMDDKSLASGSYDGTAGIWDVVTGHQVKLFKGHREGVTSATFSPDGRTLFTGSTDHVVIIWNVVTGREMVRLRDFGEAYLRISPDGRTLAVGRLAADGTTPIHLFKAPSMVEIEARERAKR